MPSIMKRKHKYQMWTEEYSDIATRIWQGVVLISFWAKAFVSGEDFTLSVRKDMKAGV